eukprot:scaffold218338_cov12-Tisochrysis_lutea.AAC.1
MPANRQEGTGAKQASPPSDSDLHEGRAFGSRPPRTTGTCLQRTHAWYTCLPRISTCRPRIT